MSTSLQEIRVVEVQWPKPEAQRGRRDSWSGKTARALPMSRYPDILETHPRAAAALHADHVWVQVIADDGTWGLGRSAFGSPVAQIIERTIAPMLTGLDAFALEAHNDLMWRACLRAGSTGHAVMARSAVDLALWDLKGKLLGVPVYSLLGGPVRKRVSCYATSDDVDWALELGFHGVKISNPVYHEEGQSGLDRVEEKVAHTRQMIGSKIDLMLNPIMAFNVDYSVRLAERLRPYELRWLEEPLQPWDFEGLSQIRQRAPFMPLATGEDHHGRHVFSRLVEDRSVDVLQPDLEWCGGLTEALKIHHIAEAAGLDVIPHVAANSPWGQHFASAMPNSTIAEYWMGSDPGIPLEQTDRIPGTPVPINGWVEPSDRPGFGIEIDEEWINPRRASR